MNQILHTASHSQCVKMIMTRAVFGGAMCVVCATVTLADAVNRSGFDFDLPWNAPSIAPSIATASVHVGPAQSAFIPESFRGVRLLNTQPVPQQLRPSRLPPTGFFDESMTNNRIAARPHESRLPVTVPSQ